MQIREIVMWDDNYFHRVIIGKECAIEFNSFFVDIGAVNDNTLNARIAMSDVTELIRLRDVLDEIIEAVKAKKEATDANGN